MGGQADGTGVPVREGEIDTPRSGEGMVNVGRWLFGVGDGDGDEVARVWDSGI
jgi:hypothetical protein